MILPLHEILSELFVETAAVQSSSLIRKHELERMIDDTIVQINIALEDEKRSTTSVGYTDISPIAVAFLTGINDVVGPISDQKEKHELKYLLAQISDQIINQYISLSKGRPEEILKRLSAAIKCTCRVRGYDSQDLEKYLPIENKARTVEVAVKSTSVVSANRQENLPWYCWGGDEKKKNALLEGLIQHDIIKSKKDFEKLFKPSVEPLDIKVDPKKLDHLMVLVLVLSDPKVQLLQPKVNKGHFHPLAVHAVDLDGNKLFKNRPKSELYALKKNQVRWQKAKTFVQRFITLNKITDVDVESTLAKVNPEAGMK